MKRLESVVRKEHDETESKRPGSAETQWVMKRTRAVTSLMTVTHAQMIVKSLDVVMVDLVSVSLHTETL